MEDAESGKMLGSIYCLNEKRQVKKLWSQIGVSNGLEWSADHKTMYYIDSFARSVDAFDYDVNAVTLSNRRTIIKIENVGSDIYDPFSYFQIFNWIFFGNDRDFRME